MDWKEIVYEFVRKIPKGKVSTYGTISKYINRNWKVESGKSRITARMVGWALHNNPDSGHIPCHRVVDRNGKLADNFVFGGWKEQKKRLLTEGVKFKKSERINLDIFVYSFK